CRCNVRSEIPRSDRPARPIRDQFYLRNSWRIVYVRLLTEEYSVDGPHRISTRIDPLGIHGLAFRRAAIGKSNNRSSGTITDHRKTVNALVVCRGSHRFTAETRQQGSCGVQPLTIDVTLGHKRLVARTRAPIKPDGDDPARAIADHAWHRLVSCPRTCQRNASRCPGRLAACIQVLGQYFNWESVLPYDVGSASAIIRHSNARMYLAIENLPIIPARDAQVCFIPDDFGCQDRVNCSLRRSKLGRVCRGDRFDGYFRGAWH